MIWSRLHQSTIHGPETVRAAVGRCWASMMTWGLPISGRRSVFQEWEQSARRNRPWGLHLAQARRVAGMAGQAQVAPSWAAEAVSQEVMGPPCPGRCPEQRYGSAPDFALTP
jgi:hypothetical protein